MSYGEINQKGALKSFKDVKEKKNVLQRRILGGRSQDRSDMRSLCKMIRL